MGVSDDRFARLVSTGLRITEAARALGVPAERLCDACDAGGLGFAPPAASQWRSTSVVVVDLDRAVHEIGLWYRGDPAVLAEKVERLTAAWVARMLERDHGA